MLIAGGLRAGSFPLRLQGVARRCQPLGPGGEEAVLLPVEGAAEGDGQALVAEEALFLRDPGFE